MKRLLLLLLLPFLAQARGTDLSDWHVLEVKGVYIDYFNFKYAQEPFLAPTYHPKDRLDLHLDLEMVDGIFFLDNMIHSETDETQYRLIGWNYRAGIHLGNSLDIFIEHFSQHLLDITPNTSNSYDAVGFRLYFYKK